MHGVSAAREIRASVCVRRRREQEPSHGDFLWHWHWTWLQLNLNCYNTRHWHQTLLFFSLIRFWLSHSCHCAGRVDKLADTPSCVWGRMWYLASTTNSRCWHKQCLRKPAWIYWQPQILLVALPPHDPWRTGQHPWLCLRELLALRIIQHMHYSIIVDGKLVQQR